jgi:hypothetical protein
MAPAAGGTAWRCLRCGAFVTGGPFGRGPAAGRELRSDLLLRVFAVDRFLRFLILGAAAYRVWRFSYDRAGLQRAFNHALRGRRQSRRQACRPGGRGRWRHGRPRPREPCAPPS